MTDYEALKAYGFSAAKAAEIVLDATRDDRFAIHTIGLARGSVGSCPEPSSADPSAEVKPTIIVQVKAETLDVITSERFAAESQRLIRLHYAAPNMLAALRIGIEDLESHLSETWGPDEEDWRETVFWRALETMRAAVAGHEGVAV